MTNPKWIITLVTLFVVFTIICGIVDGTYGVNPSKLSVLLLPDWKHITTWFGNLWDILWFNYSFFDGPWVIVKYVLFWPVSIGLVVSFGATMLVGLAGIIKGLFGGIG